MDLDKIKELLALMDENDLAEVEIEEEGKKVRLRKTEVKMAPVVAAARAPEQAPAQIQQAPERPKDCVEIPSPMVGTFYRAGSPDADPYVKIGDVVEPETIVCIIEAMKVMNEIKAEMHGEIVDILVENGDVIEFGQPLFLIRPTRPQPEGEKKA
jgi:acetyl-CoA carboxylase biotin carboxyl carrier protein